MQVPHTLSGEGFAVGAEGRLNSRDSEVEVEPENNLYPPPGVLAASKRTPVDFVSWSTDLILEPHRQNPHKIARRSRIHMLRYARLDR